jgi:hypothetical protein
MNINNDLFANRYQEIEVDNDQDALFEVDMKRKKNQKF